MQNYADFNRKNLVQFREELNSLLNKYGAHVNLEFSVGDMKFTSTEVKMTVKSKIAGVESSTEKAVRELLSMRGFKEKGTIPQHGECTVVDYVRRRYKRPWVIKTAKGKTLCASDQHMKAWFM